MHYGKKYTPLSSCTADIQIHSLEMAKPSYKVDRKSLDLMLVLGCVCLVNAAPLAVLVISQKQGDCRQWGCSSGLDWVVNEPSGQVIRHSERHIRASVAALLMNFMPDVTLLFTRRLVAMFLNTKIRWKLSSVFHSVLCTVTSTEIHAQRGVQHRNCV